MQDTIKAFKQRWYFKDFGYSNILSHHGGCFQRKVVKVCACKTCRTLIILRCLIQTSCTHTPHSWCWQLGSLSWSWAGSHGKARKSPLSAWSSSLTWTWTPAPIPPMMLGRIKGKCQANHSAKLTYPVHILVWIFTLGLHACADQSQRVTRQLATCARNGPTAEKNQHAWVSSVFSIPRQPGVLQGLYREKESKLHLFMFRLKRVCHQMSR